MILILWYEHGFLYIGGLKRFLLPLKAPFFYEIYERQGFMNQKM